MSEPDELYEQSLREIGAHAGALYAEAAEQGGELESRDDSAPLFHALKEIRDRYENAERIARGGTKEVWRVHDRRSTRDVAMAKPLPSLGENDYDAFLREAHITARLDHPGIVKLFDMGIDADGRPFFTMELKKGRSLRQLLQEARDGADFPLSQRLSILRRVCEAVAYAHSRRVLHLDLKPENIQVGEFGEVQVCDWGMSLVLRPDAGELEETEVLLDPDLYGPLLMHSRGTPGYMAPEQSEPGRPKSIAMDVYSLGCLLQELLTLQAPDHTQAPSKPGDDVLGSIVTKACRRNPAERYPTVSGLHHDLTRHLSGYRTSVERAGFLREAQLFYGRHRSACLLVAALLLLAAMGTAVFIQQLRQSREDAVAARVAAERARELYRSQKLQAETTLHDYLAAIDESDRRLEEQAQMTARSVVRLTRKPFPTDEDGFPRIVAEGRQRLDRVIALNPPPESPVWFQKFWLLFLAQDLRGALSVAGGDLEPVQDLVALAHKHLPAQPDSGPLPAAAFGQLMRDLIALREPHRTPLMERMLVYDMRFPRTDAERAAILREVLAAMNPDAPEVNLLFEPRQRSVEVQGSEVRTLSLRAWHDCSNLSLLRFLKPREVLLRGTKLADLGELNGLQPLRIDLRDTEVTDLQPLAGMHYLQQVLVTPGRFTERQLSILKERD
ncbi:protein kinase [Haloferula sp. A504]|uniref:serine/threonine protein kinase n=1 Tax=Haloferula sp. A504 TaxID=3373601 RepID=UPI0031C6B7A4|nr:serine/threonine protein kinase [Verrucomicrobiaceae bacterium E54]